MRLFRSDLSLLNSLNSLRKIKKSATLVNSKAWITPGKKRGLDRRRRRETSLTHPANTYGPSVISSVFVDPYPYSAYIPTAGCFVKRHVAVPSLPSASSHGLPAAHVSGVTAAAATDSSASPVTAAMLSPLAVDDVFRRQTVPEIQELLRQLQLQQANDAEELRSLIGVRYLSFLEGLPEISRMQQAAHEALQEAKELGKGLCCLADALASKGINAGESRAEGKRLHQHRFLVERELPLQRSTPLDDFLFARGINASMCAAIRSPLLAVHRNAGLSTARTPVLTTLEIQEGEETLHQPQTLQRLQQQLLLFPSRVCEAVRCQQFLQALRLIHIEGAQQAASAKAVVLKLQQLQRPRKHEKPSQESGCWALAQHTVEISPALESLVRALALRHLASPNLPLPLLADAVAAATLTYLLDSWPALQDATEGAEEAVITSAAKWLLEMFFSARGEALKSLAALRGAEEGTAASGAAIDAVCGYHTRERGTLLPAVDAAEGLLVAFSASLESAAFLFSPTVADAAEQGAAACGATEGPSGGSEEPPFAVVHAAQAAFKPLSSSGTANNMVWALQALPRVFAVFAAQPCSSSKRGWGCACQCGNAEFCPRARSAAFVEHWNGPLRTWLCRLPAQEPRLSLSSVRAFWVTMPSTAQLLRALGASCANACLAVSESRMRALPLLSVPGGRGGTALATATFSGENKKCSFERFEQALRQHLADIAALFGGTRDLEELRAAVPLRAALIGSLFQSLADCAAPLVAAASAAAATAGAAAGDSHVSDAAEAPLIEDARRLEWLFVACTKAECSYQRLAPREADRNLRTWFSRVLSQGSETTPCQDRLAAFLAEWTASEPQTIELEKQRTQARDDESTGEPEAGGSAQKDRIVAATREAAKSLPSGLCFAALAGYAVSLWPFVRTAVKDLQAAWLSQKRVLSSFAPEPDEPDLGISGAAMVLLLELNRRLVTASRRLKLADLSAAPLLSFSLKAVAAEEIAIVASDAIAKAAYHPRQQSQHALFQDQSFLLQLLVDVELLAVALDAPPPSALLHTTLNAPEALPRPLQKAIENGLRSQHSAEALVKVASQGRQWLHPPLAEKLTRCVKAGFAASSSLLFALLKSNDSEAGEVSHVSATSTSGAKCSRPILLVPNERLSLLPVAPLPVFAALVRPFCDKKSDTEAQPVSSDSEQTRKEKPDQPKESVMQMHRLRLDDAVDSVSRGLQSWLKRGAPESEGVGFFPLMSGGSSSSSGASRGLAAMSVTGGGLAEVWAKQVEHVSALIGQHVESVQSRAAHSTGLNISQRSGTAQGGSLPTSPTADQRMP
ncbi:uncharacterized protein LOC34617515 [Cyclospora cayetanensis]|uniref:Uncharacterized protein LOC34617515 n=1 Tax=Cyclospora cayetanensis TaxID=88456 RepID=A0A6P6RTQ9_9EIME|nr:uncharacterized protein LOC34617515 [Cyclospora cayetanensis]